MSIDGGTEKAHTRAEDSYESVLRVLSKQLDDEDEKQDFEERIPSLSKKLVDFSKYFTSVIQVAFSPSLSRKERIQQIAELKCCDGKGMSASQASNIISRLYATDARPVFNMNTRPKVIGGAIGVTREVTREVTGEVKGGQQTQKSSSPLNLLNYIPPTQQNIASGVASGVAVTAPERPRGDDRNADGDDDRRGSSGDLTKWLPRFIEKSLIDDRFRGVNTKYDIAGDRGASAAAKFGRIFKYFLLKLPMTYGLKLMYPLAGSPIEGVQIEDFVKKMDFTYYILFVLANVPFFGFFANIYTILTAIDDGRIYLACITLIGTILSLFTLHYFDMGLFFKIFYWMDVNYEVDGYKPPVLNPESNVVRISGGRQSRRPKGTRKRDSKRKRRVIRRMR
jgi:hypothetical protein